MKLGLESYSTRNSGLDPLGVLELAQRLGLQGVLFELSPFTSFRDDALTADSRSGRTEGPVRRVRHGVGVPLASHGGKRA